MLPSIGAQRTVFETIRQPLPACGLIRWVTCCLLAGGFGIEHGGRRCRRRRRKCRPTSKQSISTHSPLVLQCCQGPQAQQGEKKRQGQGWRNSLHLEQSAPLGIAHQRTSRVLRKEGEKMKTPLQVRFCAPGRPEWRTAVPPQRRAGRHPGTLHALCAYSTTFRCPSREALRRPLAGQPPLCMPERPAKQISAA